MVVLPTRALVQPVSAWKDAQHNLVPHRKPRRFAQNQAYGAAGALPRHHAAMFTIRARRDERNRRSDGARDLINSVGS